MLTIRPVVSDAIKLLDMACVIRKQPVRLVLITCCQSSVGVSTSRLLVTVPALLIKIVTVPKFCSIVLIATLMLVGSLTSMLMGRVVPLLFGLQLWRIRHQYSVRLAPQMHQLFARKPAKERQDPTMHLLQERFAHLGKVCCHVWILNQLAIALPISAANLLG